MAKPLWHHDYRSVFTSPRHHHYSFQFRQYNHTSVYDTEGVVQNFLYLHCWGAWKGSVTISLWYPLQVHWRNKNKNKTSIPHIHDDIWIDKKKSWQWKQISIFQQSFRIQNTTTLECHYTALTHEDWNRMTTILQMVFSNASFFPWKCLFWLNFYKKLSYGSN